MRYPIILAFLAAFLVSASLDPACAQLADTGNFHIVWEVKNRFRLFRKESDFLHQVAASRGDGVLAAERRLEASNGGVGWAQDVVGNLCLDDYGNLLQTCSRDGATRTIWPPAIMRLASGFPVRCRRAKPAPGRSTTATDRFGR